MTPSWVESVELAGENQLGLSRPALESATTNRLT